MVMTTDILAPALETSIVLERSQSFITGATQSMMNDR